MLQYIKNAKNEIAVCRKNFTSSDWVYVEKTIYRKYIFSGIESDLTCYNYAELLENYCAYFASMKIPTITIYKGQLFYRGRIGGITVPGSIDDCNRTFSIPYYGSSISAAPPLFVSGSRFNRDGVSYLYLATDIKTALSEIHAEVGQRCSIAEFTCKNEVQLLDLSSSPYNIELQIWYELLTQPIHSEIKYKYRITQFISEVLSSVNANGIYFKSTQSSGFNVVCFNPAHFELNKYSERLYITTEIKYEYMADPEDDIVKYTKRDDYQQINGCNTHDEDTTENQVDYMKEWIEYRRNNQ